MQGMCKGVCVCVLRFGEMLMYVHNWFVRLGQHKNHQILNLSNQ